LGGHARNVRSSPDARLTEPRQGRISEDRDLSGMARFDRQRAEIIATLRAGDLARAQILGAEHLLEFPDDDVVRAALRSAGCEA
jgi:hypothetical protein